MSGVSRAAQLLLIAPLIALLCHITGVHSLYRVDTLDPALMKLNEGHCYTAPLPVSGASGQLVAPLLELFEDGHPLAPRDVPHAEIRTLGGGRYSHWYNDLYFSASDNSDPRTNRRVYSVRYVTPVPWWGAALLFGLVAASWWRTLSSLLARTAAMHPAYLALLVALLSLGFRLLILIQNRTLTYDGHLVLGMPFSDARGWDTLSREFSLGLREDLSWRLWAARRPLYYWVLGSLFVFTGPHLAVAIAFKVLLGVLGSVLIYDIGRRLTNSNVGILVASTQSFLVPDAFDALIPRTEGLGSFLTILATWLLLLALGRGSESGCKVSEGAASISRDELHIFLAGVALAASNLARPLTLLGVGFIPLLLLLLRAARLREIILPSIPTLRMLVGFLLGAAVTLAPWLLRQYYLFGITSISDNSGEMLLAAADPRFKTWSSEVSALYPGGHADLGARFIFYNELASRAVRENFWFYITNVLSYLRDITKALVIPRWLPFGALLLALMACSSSWRELSGRARLAVGGAAAGILVLALSQPSGWVLWLLALPLSLAKRSRAAALGTVLLSAIVALSLCASMETRMLSSLTWIVSALASWAIFSLVTVLPLTVTARPPEPAWGAAWSRWVTTLSASLLALLALGGVVALARFYQNPSMGSPLLGDASLEAKIIGDILEVPACRPFQAFRDKIALRAGRRRPDYYAVLPAEANINHWSKVFTPRPFPIVVFETLPMLPEVYAALPASSLPMQLDGPLTLLGIPRHFSFENVFEVLVVARYNQSTDKYEPVYGCDDTHRVAEYSSWLVEHLAPTQLP